jgi:hypothetical protein
VDGVEAEGGGCVVPGDGAGEGVGEGGGDDIESVGATNCVRLGIWVVRRGSPRPTAAPLLGDILDGALTPGSGLPSGALTGEGAVVTDDVALAVAALVVGTVANADAPSAVSPVVAMDVRLSLLDLLV